MACLVEKAQLLQVYDGAARGTLLHKCLVDASGGGEADSFDFCQTLRFIFNDVKGLFMKGVHNPCGKGMANAFKKTAGEVSADAFVALGHTGFHADHFELFAIDFMCCHRAIEAHVFPRVYRRHAADANQIFAVVVQFDNGIAVFVVSEQYVNNLSLYKRQSRVLPYDCYKKYDIFFDKCKRRQKESPAPCGGGR